MSEKEQQDSSQNTNTDDAVGSTTSGSAASGSTSADVGVEEAVSAGATEDIAGNVGAHAADNADSGTATNSMEPELPEGADPEAANSANPDDPVHYTDAEGREKSDELEAISKETSDGAASKEASLEAVTAESLPQTQVTESPAAQASPPVSHAHFKPIPQEKLAKAKRKRRVLIVIIVLLIVLLAGTVATGVYYYLNYAQPPVSTIEQPTVEIDNTDTVQDRGTAETVAMPNLAQLFGKTPEEVVAILGPDYVITKTDTSSDDVAATEEAGEGEGNADATSTADPNTTITSVVTISYTPQSQTSTVGSAQVQNIYLSLNAAGATVELYFVSSMNILDIPHGSFASLVESSSSISSTLALAGLTLAPDYAYTPPTEADYIEYVDADASEKMIRKETTTIKGTLLTEQPPTNFELTYTYDYGATGVAVTPDRQPSQRMLYIKLS